MPEIDTSSYKLPTQPGALDTLGKLQTLKQQEQSIEGQRVNIDKAKLDLVNQGMDYLMREVNSLPPNATPEDLEKFADKTLNAQLKHLNATSNRSEDMTLGSGFDKLPTNEKKRAVGLTTAMGLDPVEGTQMLRSGLTLQEIADARGVNLEDFTPVYPLGEENIKQLQRRTGFVNEIKNLEGNLAGAMGEYQNKIMGYSLDQVADALSGENPDKQGKVLAARALQPELAALRLKVAGGNIGIEAINELKSKSLGDLKILESLVDKPTYIAMQKYMTKWLEEATNEFPRTQEDYGRLKTRQQKSAADESDMGDDPLGLF